MIEISNNPVDTRHRSLKSYRRLIDAETMSCVYWETFTASLQSANSLTMNHQTHGLPKRPGLTYRTVVYDLGLSGHTSHKSHTRKNGTIHKNFELYQVFKHNFLCQNVRIFPYFLLMRRISTFWSRG